jgi:hypothetical protein
MFMDEHSNSTKNRGIGQATSGLDAAMLSNSETSETAPAAVDYEETRQLVLQIMIGAAGLMMVVLVLAVFISYRRARQRM